MSHILKKSAVQNYRPLYQQVKTNKSNSSIISRKSTEVSKQKHNRSSVSSISSALNCSKIHTEDSSSDKNKDIMAQLQELISKGDAEVDEMLNHSVKQLQKLIKQDSPSQGIVQQNLKLKNTLSKMKSVLKEKLQQALQKQKNQMSEILNEYVALITKLLKDKDDLSNKLEELQKIFEHDLKAKDDEYSEKLRLFTLEKEQQLLMSSRQVEQLLQIIGKYQELAKSDQLKIFELQKEIQALKMRNQSISQTEFSSFSQLRQPILLRWDQEKKELIAIIERFQSENGELIKEIEELKARIKDNMQLQKMKDHYQNQIENIIKNHEEEISSYQNTVRETFIKKDECIKRLNLIIEGWREKERI